MTDGDHPYMGNWWVPGLQIGYEHSFVHQVADFLDGLGDRRRSRRCLTSAMPTGRNLCSMRFLDSAKGGTWVNIKK